MVLDLLRARLGSMLTTRGKLTRRIRKSVMGRRQALEAIKSNMAAVSGDPGFEVLTTIVDGFDELFNFEHDEEKDLVLLEDRELSDIKDLEQQAAKLKDLEVSEDAKKRLVVLYDSFVKLHKDISTKTLTLRKRTREMVWDKERLSVQLANVLTNDRRETRAVRRSSKEEAAEAVELEEVMDRIEKFHEDPVKLEKYLKLYEDLMNSYARIIEENFEHFFRLMNGIVLEHHEGLELLARVQHKVAGLDQNMEPIKNLAAGIIKIINEDKSEQRIVGKQLRQAA